MKINISYATMVCNELNEIKKLYNTIYPKLKDDDEFIIIVDESNKTEEVELYVNSLISDNVKVYYNSLNKDFAQQKNFMNSKCSKTHIFNIDSDELPHENLLENIKELLTLNSKVDVYRVPRINIVNGITDDYIKQVGWVVDPNAYNIVREMEIDTESYEYGFLKKYGCIIEETEI